MRIYSLSILIAFIWWNTTVIARDSEKKDFLTQPALARLASSPTLAKVITGILKTEHFIEKTGLHTQLGGREVYPEGIELKVRLSIYDYLKYLKKGGVSSQQINAISATLDLQCPRLVKAILEAKDTVD